MNFMERGIKVFIKIDDAKKLKRKLIQFYLKPNLAPKKLSESFIIFS